MTDDFGKQAYLDISDELTGPDLMGVAYVESDYDPMWVKEAKTFAAKHFLPYPPPADVDAATVMVEEALHSGSNR